MNLEEYVKHEFGEVKKDLKELDAKVDKLIIALAVIKDKDRRKAQINTAVISVICSLTSSGLMYVVAKLWG